MNIKNNIVLACIDGSVITSSVVDHASWIADKASAPLKLLHNIENHSVVKVDMTGNIGLGASSNLLDELTELEAKRSKLLKAQGQELLNSAAQRAKQFNINGPILSQRHGSLSETLVELEDQLQVLVVGLNGEDHQQSDHAIGNHIETIVRSLHRPILVVNKVFTKPERIMLAYDNSVAAEKALTMITTSPIFSNIECHIVHVTKNENKDVSLLNIASKRLENAGLSYKTANLCGSAHAELTAYQQKHDIQMLVMGSFGHSKLRDMLLGSFTLKMLQSSSIPLLLLR